MTKANYIDWENLRNIPFFLCQVVEDEENQEIVIYYFGERVLHDYDHVGHYLRSAIVLFRHIQNRTATGLTCVTFGLSATAFGRTTTTV